jgi:hypothetical protein
MQIIVATAAIFGSWSTSGLSLRRCLTVITRNGRDAIASAGYRKLSAVRYAGTSVKRLITMSVHPPIAAYSVCHPAKRDIPNKRNAARIRMSLMLLILICSSLPVSGFHKKDPAGPKN